MSIIGRFLPNFLNNFRPIIIQERSITTGSVLNHVREHFTRPNERRRILRHGWFKRMSTPGGRRVLMNRILKGRHVYAHK